MGAINFSIDKELARLLAEMLSIKSFVETGTFQGDSVASVLDLFDRLDTCELSEKLYLAAKKRFDTEPKVTCHHGDSPEFLRSISRELSGQPILYWLDAHWCSADQTVESDSPCPLLRELEEIGELHPDSVIWIDDARYFLSPPPSPLKSTGWPTFHAVMEMMLKLGRGNHRIICANDTLLLYPVRIEPAVMEYLHVKGADWLDISHKAKVVIPELIKKIHQLNAAYETEKEKSLYERISSHIYYSITKKIFRLLNHFSKKKCSSDSYWMNLGVLHQYEPRKPVKNTHKNNLQNTQNLPSIAIVTPSYNQEEYLEQTILSVLSNKYSNLQYAVVDGGSTDGSPHIIHRYSERLAYSVSEPDGGQSDAIVKGFKRIEGEIMGYLNSDDILLPASLDYVGSYFQKHPHVDVIYGHRLIIDENGQEIGRWILPQHCHETLRRVDWIPQETMFWRKSIYDKVGGIDPNLSFAMDWDLILRFMNAGANFKRVPKFLACFRAHKTQKTHLQYETIGAGEVHRLRIRELGDDESQWKLKKYSNQYERKAKYYSFLADMGIMS